MKKNIEYAAIFMLSVALLILTGCAGSRGIMSESALDTPELHYETGMRALNTDRLSEAEHEFRRSIDLALGRDYEFGPGHEGLGLVYLMRGDLRNAELEMERALDIDKNYALAYVGLGRVYSAKGKNKDALKQFDKALKKDPQCKEAPFYKAKSYEKMEMWNEAERSYEQALNIDPQFMAADIEFKRVQDERRASSGMNDDMQKIARESAIDRADIAVLFSKNLPLERLFGRRTSLTAQKFETPNQAGKVKSEKRLPIISDIENHWAKAYINKMLEYGLLELYPDNKFRPDEPITKANYAMLVQKVLVQAQNDPDLTTRYFGNTSPFSDVMNSHYAFNSIMVATTQGIIKPRFGGQTFGLSDSVSGADGILIVKLLKEQLK